MNYIVLDLEWNQCPTGKSNENTALPFEIVEIGAVKLDENRNRLGEFHQYVAPQVYEELHHITRDLLKVSMAELKKGLPFSEVMTLFFQWCEAEGDYRFCTWGSMDLTELQRNCRFFEVEQGFPMPFVYYDLQKLYSICYDDGKSRKALETAATELLLEKNSVFHSAMNDAIYTAQIMAQMDFDRVKGFTSVDTFRIPQTRKEEYTLVYDTYSKFVSKGYSDRDAMIADGYLLTSKCYLCGKNARKKIRWFSGNQKTYYCVAVCTTHGYLKGRMKIKKTDDDRYYAVKIMKLTDEAGYNAIKQKQLACRERRRERRRREHHKEENTSE